MTDKTCGSCINLMRDYIEDQNGYVGGACRVSLFGGKYRYVLCAAICSEPLGLYEERTDSLEAVALDAVRKLEKAAALIDVERWERIVYSQADDLMARLKALGVEP